ncbi:hypothetical protein IEO21_04384 [Rhodonia placenta]|uniref:Uncharacterized protein n=1 Tax=Rhodonia placenta TaxID=104341 RepID=A0A8H7P427_9APHY|nr:hypothetical protein IEO21_04384 [Postia placenta]
MVGIKPCTRESAAAACISRLVSCMSKSGESWIGVELKPWYTSTRSDPEISREVRKKGGDPLASSGSISVAHTDPLPGASGGCYRSAGLVRLGGPQVTAYYGHLCTAVLYEGAGEHHMPSRVTEEIPES